MILETRTNVEGLEHITSFDPGLREMLLHDVYEVPEDVFEEIDATVAVLCCPQCWETGLSLETIPHKPGCPLASTRAS
ncbi:MAG TPA: hypothetical protein VEW48_08130 [Thermoanaerobaculia bacterium]|nr:hypothetical protein [Thermoanaerobaculia bacterium]